MVKIAVIGGGVCGLLTGMLLADDGHEVVVLERDPAQPPAPTDAWEDWERNSVRQFHMGHYFLPRFRLELERELPRAIAGLESAGALRLNPMETIPDAIRGSWRDGDERFEVLTGRRPMVEAVLAGLADETAGMIVRRGVVVSGLLTESAESENPVHITGVVTSDGEQLDADLVVDASGRNSGLPRLLAAVGAQAPVDEADDSGFVYYGRAYRSADGSLPASIGGGLQAYGSISTLTLPADNGTWQIAFVASGKDKVMRKVRDEESFNKLWKSYPLVAHWVDGEPLSEIEMMGNLEDRIRHFVVDGSPVATGVATVGDSWACSNPSVGRGASIGLLHSIALRDQLRAESLEGRVEWALSWDRRTTATVEPFIRETIEADRHRLGQIEAAMAGRPYESDDPAFVQYSCLVSAAFKDPDLLRAWLDLFMLHRMEADVFADVSVVGRMHELQTEGEAPPGPNRAELEAILS